MLLQGVPGKGKTLWISNDFNLLEIASTFQGIVKPCLLLYNLKELYAGRGI